MREKTVGFLRAKVFYKDEEAAKKWGDKVVILLQNLDKTMGEQTWIAGTDKPSIADLSAWSELYAQSMPGIDFNVYPNIKAWMERLVKSEMQI